MRIHRSTVVNRRVIDRLVHRGRIWTAVLSRGENLRIAKSHVADVVHALRDDSATPERISAMKYRVGDVGTGPVENAMQDNA